MEKQLEPAIAAMVADFIAAGRPKASQLSWQARRDGYLASALLGGEREEVDAIEEWQADHHAIRCYRPADKPDPAYPVLIYFHGGCFVSGDFETHDRQMRMLCNRASALIFAVHTRLAPEHTYPAAHDDALAAARAIMAEVEKWHGDPARLAIAGDSAGGHLALITTLRLKAANAPLPKALLLLYPMLDALCESQSYRDLGDDYLITRDMLASGFHAYLGSLPPAIPKPARSTIPPCQDYRRPISSRRNMIRCATKGKPCMASWCRLASMPLASGSMASSTATSNWRPSALPLVSSSTR